MPPRLKHPHGAKSSASSSLEVALSVGAARPGPGGRPGRPGTRPGPPLNTLPQSRQRLRGRDERRSISGLREHAGSCWLSLDRRPHLRAKPRISLPATRMRTSLLDPNLHGSSRHRFIKLELDVHRVPSVGPTLRAISFAKKLVDLREGLS